MMLVLSFFLLLSVLRNVADAGWEQQYPITASANAIWGSSGSDVFAVGPEGSVLHYSGSNWSPMEKLTDNSLSGVWGSSANDVFAVGANGTILHYNGSNWKLMTSGTTNELCGVWGSSASDVFAVGGVNGQIILHYDGSSWSSMVSVSGTPGEMLCGVWGSSGNESLRLDTMAPSSILTAAVGVL